MVMGIHQAGDNHRGGPAQLFIGLVTGLEVIIPAYGFDYAVPLKHGPVGDDAAGPGVLSGLADNILSPDQRSRHGCLHRMAPVSVIMGLA